MKRIILILNENCNINCKYCYVNKSNRRITEKIILKTLLFFKKLSKKSKDLRQIILSGGEPLLEYDLIKRIVILSRTVLRNDLFIGIPTNGTLLDSEKLYFFRKNNVNLAISIDGFGKYNNNRITKNKRSIFRLLEEKKDLFLQYNDIIRIRLTISPKFAKYSYKNLIYFYKMGFKRIDVQPVIGWFWSSQQIDEYVSNFKKIIDFSIKHKIDLKSFVDRKINLKKTYCCGKIGEEVMIDPIGNIYPCAFFLFFKHKERKKFNIGNINDKNLIINKKINNLKTFKMCDFIKNLCKSCKKSIACTKYCFCFNMKNKKFDRRIARSNFILEKMIENTVLKSDDKCL